MSHLLSLVALVIAMFVTWSWTTCESEIDLDTHTSIQTQLVNVIEATATKYRPDVQKIHFKKLWTEILRDRQIKASFKFEMKSEDGSQRIGETVTGYALLNETEGKEWSVDVIELSEQAIEFEDGLLITPEK